MGSNTSKCSKKEDLYCFNNKVLCECPNGIPAPGYCTKKNPHKCLKCLPNYGSKNGKIFGGGGDKDIASGNFNEYNNNIKGFSETEKDDLSVEYNFQINPNIENNKYSYFSNLPNANNTCEIIEDIKLIKKKK